VSTQHDYEFIEDFNPIHKSGFKRPARNRLNHVHGAEDKQKLALGERPVNENQYHSGYQSSEQKEDIVQSLREVICIEVFCEDTIPSAELRCVELVTVLVDHSPSPEREDPDHNNIEDSDC